MAYNLFLLLLILISELSQIGQWEVHQAGFCVFLDAILKGIVSLFVSIKKCNQFLYVNLVSCYLAEFIYQF